MKKLLALLLALTMLLGLAACGAKEETAQTPVDTEESSAVQEETAEEAEVVEETEEKESVTIEAFIVATEWQDNWDEMESRFEEQYPWIDIQAVGDAANGATFIASRQATDDLPALVMLDNNETWRLLVDEGKIMDISGQPACANVPQSYLDAFTYDGVTMGITHGSAFSTMFYNMQQLNAAGWDAPPANWEELLQCCADLEAAGYVPLTVAGAKTTTMWMLFELIIANEVGDELGQGVYEEQFMNGTFDFTAYPGLVSKLDALLPYFLQGSATLTEDDTVAVMAEGSAAMCIAGNWYAAPILDAIAECTGDASMGAASLPPFQSEGEACWISVSPETAIGITLDEDRTEAEQEAVEIFFNWYFQPENFCLVQNMAGTVPVLTNMTEDLIVLPEQITAIISDMSAAPYVKMGFNLWTAEFSDVACTALKDCLGGNGTAQDAVDSMCNTLQSSHVN